MSTLVERLLDDSTSTWQKRALELRHEAADRIVALEAEVVTLKRKLDDAAQLIKMRTADCATLKAENAEYQQRWTEAAAAAVRRQEAIDTLRSDNANHLKLNATLIYERDKARSDNADLRAEAEHSANFAKAEATYGIT